MPIRHIPVIKMSDFFIGMPLALLIAKFIKQLVMNFNKRYKQKINIGGTTYVDSTQKQ